MADWDPAQYLRFANERLQPALDLLARIPAPSPRLVVDLGCGAGNVTTILKARFAGADVVGIDSSPAMLAKAREAAPDCRFLQGDFTGWDAGGLSDVLFSNAALHWTGEHETLFPHLLERVSPGGWLAVQMPAMHDAPLRALQYQVAGAGPWAPALRGIGSARAILTPGEYWDILRPHAASLDIWETIYLHVLTGEDAVGEWAAGTSLRPFLDPLTEGLRAGFRRAYAAALAPHYPRRADGTTLLPFRRLFLLARR
jgi:trans-aconitate 2-methyltransferase